LNALAKPCRSAILDDAQVQSLLAGTHADPFAVLGLHHLSSGQIVLRALLPGASHVSVLDASTSNVIAQMDLRDVGGFFECELAQAPPEYRLQIQFKHETVVLADTYSFGAQLSEAELLAFSQGRHLRPHLMLGAHAISAGGIDGVRFAVWAPNARRVSVVGSFNGWDGRRHMMRLRHQAGVWELFIPHIQNGDLYKFELLDRNGHLLPLKADPYARKAELRPGTASIVAGLPTPIEIRVDRTALNDRHAPISIYEVHIGSWQVSETGEFLDWVELAQRLPKYAADLGFTHIELMPISEFPFDGSWGYQTLGLFAPSARFGTPEAFARFVTACHTQGLGLLLDWVPAHFPSDTHGLAQFDGTALYEYADPKEGFHKDWNTLIYNFGRTEVRSFLSASALYWIEHFGIDGLRVDAVASMLYRDYSRNAGEWLPNHLGGRENLEAISLFKQINEQVSAAGGITIAEESTAFPNVSAPTYAGGLGFHFKWNMGWMNDSLRYMAQNPIHRPWHHELMSFGLVYAFSENYVLPISHDEVVHGKGSMLTKMPGDRWQQFANLRAYYGFMWGHPGKKLLFMGQEFAQIDEWNHQFALPWYLLEYAPHAGMRNLIRDLNLLYRNSPALHKLDCLAIGFRWLILDDSQNSVYAWARFDDVGNAMLVVCNFTPLPRHNYHVPVPEGFSAFAEALNTDSQYYGGSNVGNGASPIAVESQAITLTLPPLATLFLRAVRS
jgi:1,4-alpha-glucan branching enzyme